MSEPGTIEVLLFLNAGICATSGGLFLTGWYGFPASPSYGIAFYVLAVMFGGIFIALIDETEKGDNRPPQEATGNGREH